MAAVADGPCPAEVRDFAIPTVGSVLVAGHNPLGAFFRAQVEPSAADVVPTPFVCDDEAVDMVDVDDAWDDSEEDEFERCALFRGMYLMYSSLPAPLGAPTPLLHLFCVNTGWATAVITVDVQRLLPE